MKKGIQIWDFVVLGPVISVFLFVIGLFIAFASAVESDVSAGTSDAVLAAFGIGGVLLYILLIVTAVAGQIYAIHRTYTRTKLDDGQKLLWLWLILLFGLITIPLVHFMHIRKHN